MKKCISDRSWSHLQTWKQSGRLPAKSSLHCSAGLLQRCGYKEHSRVSRKDTSSALRVEASRTSTQAQESSLSYPTSETGHGGGRGYLLSRKDVNNKQRCLCTIYESNVKISWVRNMFLAAIQRLCASQSLYWLFCMANLSTKHNVIGRIHPLLEPWQEPGSKNCSASWF